MVSIASTDADDDEDRDDDVEPGELRAEHPEAEPAGGRDEDDEDRGPDETSGVWPEPGDDELGGRLVGHGLMHSAGG